MKSNGLPVVMSLRKRLRVLLKREWRRERRVRPAHTPCVSKVLREGKRCVRVSRSLGKRDRATALGWRECLASGPVLTASTREGSTDPVGEE